MTKDCRDLRHEGDRELKASEFYRSGNYSDGLMTRCKKCQIERASEREHERREERKAKGLPCRLTPDERAERAEIHSRRREESPVEEARKLREFEARYQDEQSELETSPIEPGGFSSFPKEEVTLFGVRNSFQSAPVLERKWSTW